MKKMIKHFIDINDFSKKELDLILNQAKEIKDKQKKYKDIMNNKSLGLLFQKESTRTRLSFTIGMQKLGGSAIELELKKIGFGKRESEEDILKTLSQYLDCLIIRNNDHNKIKHFASLNLIPIINGLSNFTHPCQILSDIFTLKEVFGDIKNRTVCWIGDYNNVLRSLIQIQSKYLFNLNVVLPKKILDNFKLQINNIKNKNIYFTNDVKKGVVKSDCLMTDVWISMGENNSNKKNYFKKYQINNNIIKLAKKNAVFMHCLPAHRGEEVSNEVIDSSQSIVWIQAKNRIYVQQAILKYIILDQKIIKS
tara:strand:+ start:497 stop:1420 length:924 start_codon:yes stop_codon:yes gene_type:complete